MKKAFLHAALCAAFCCVAHPAAAGPHGDALARCLVSYTSMADKSLLVQWMFAALSQHPDVRRLSSATQADRDRLDRDIAVVVQRLLSESCVPETKEALQYEGPAVLQASFNVLGQVAGQELITDPNVARSVQSFVRYLDEQKIRDALR